MGEALSGQTEILGGHLAMPYPRTPPRRVEYVRDTWGVLHVFGHSDAARSLTLFGTGQPVTRDDFFRFEWDRGYEPDSEIMRQVVDPLKEFNSKDPNEREALGILQGWNGIVDETYPAATLAIRGAA